MIGTRSASLCSYIRENRSLEVMLNETASLCRISYASAFSIAFLKPLDIPASLLS